jgi:hypothetical protein
MTRTAGAVLAGLTMLCFAVPTSAQTSRGPFVGITGGAASSEIRGGGINTNFKWGGTAGLFVAYRPHWNAVTSLEGYWVQKGGKDADVDYLEFPLTFGGVAPMANGDLRLRGYAGIGVAFRISCSSEITRLDCDRANSTEWTIPFGLMFGRWTGNRTMAFDVRYSWGLTNVFENVSGQNRTWYLRAIIGLGG